MEPLQTTQDLGSSTGNPLDMGTSVPPVETSSEAPQIKAVILENAPEPEAASTTIQAPFRDVTVPPMPISSAIGTSNLTLDQTTLSQNAPQKSSALGLVIGIMLLISIVVGASLYYYFMIYTKPVPAVPTPPPVTLIKNEPKVETSEPTPPPPTTPAVDATSLITEVDGANSNLTNIDTTIGTFDEQVK